MKAHAMHYTSHGGYHLGFSFEPSKVTVGDTVTLVFKPMDSVTHETIVLQAVHEKEMHLLILSEDLSYFSHEHPHQVGDLCVHVHHFPQGAPFILFVVYSPQESGLHVSRHELKVEGKPIDHQVLSDQQTEWQAQGYKMMIPEDQLSLKANAMWELTLYVEKEGQPEKDLENYLGALAHVVIISENTNDYLHVHPLGSKEHGPEIKLLLFFHMLVHSKCLYNSATRVKLEPLHWF